MAIVFFKRLFGHIQSLGKTEWVNAINNISLLKIGLEILFFFFLYNIVTGQMLCSRSKCSCLIAVKLQKTHNFHIHCMVSIDEVFQLHVN